MEVFYYDVFIAVFLFTADRINSHDALEMNNVADLLQNKQSFSVMATKCNSKWAG